MTKSQLDLNQKGVFVSELRSDSALGISFRRYRVSSAILLATRDYDYKARVLADCELVNAPAF